MKYLQIKDKYKRLMYHKKELSRLILKSIVQNLNLDNQIRNVAMYKLDDLPKVSSSSKICNRCTITGTSKSVSRKYKISRMKLRNYGMSAAIPGVTKSTW